MTQSQGFRQTDGQTTGKLEGCGGGGGSGGCYAPTQKPTTATNQLLGTGRRVRRIPRHVVRFLCRIGFHLSLFWRVVTSLPGLVEGLSAQGPLGNLLLFSYNTRWDSTNIVSFCFWTQFARCGLPACRKKREGHSLSFSFCGFPPSPSLPLSRLSTDIMTRKNTLFIQGLTVRIVVQRRTHGT